MSSETNSESAAQAGKKPSAEIPHQREREQFHQLLLANPNYFGNLEQSPFEAKLKIAGNTTYEQLTCVGFNPTLNQLEAHVNVKQPVGYGGSLCQAGSKEYVRFYVDYGSGWTDAGLVAFDAHDIPNAADCASQANKPLSYVASLPHTPQRDRCHRPVMPNVRAILSWNLQPPPNQPNWKPVWGNVADQHVQVPPRRLTIGDLADILADKLKATIELPSEYVAIQDHPLPTPEPDPAPLAHLAKLYAGKGAKAEVEAHRFATTDLAEASLPSVFSQQIIAQKAEHYKQVGLDFGAVVSEYLNTKANVSYEELKCLGLDINRSLLAATFLIKRPAGYSGGLCQHGSLEHIAFWADWDNSCEWTYLGTVSIRVHDIASIPADGLAYTALLKVNLAAHRRNCKEPKVARVRAVLSWATPPSNTDPNQLKAWGNRLDTHVLIPPGENKTGKISIIGGIGVASINIFGNGLTTPNASFAFFGTPADPQVPSRECPFGGLVTIQGAPLVGYKYRIWVRNETQQTPAVYLTNPVFVVDNNGIGSWHSPDANGFYAYLPDTQNLNDMLGYWHTLGDDKWAIQLEIADMMDNQVDTTVWHNIQLDNTAPQAHIHIASGGDCKDFLQGSTISGQFTATDTYFGHYELKTVPLSQSPNPPSPSTGAAAVVNGAWSLNTASPNKMVPCGYVVELRVYDRSIVGSQPNSHNSNYDDVGFCLRKA